MSGLTLNGLLGGIIFAFLFILFLGFISVFNSLKIVPEEKRLAVFRMGRFIGERGPGIVFSIPFIDRTVWVELQQRFRFEYANLSTYDNRQASMTALLQGKIVNVEKAIMNVPNLRVALQKLLETRVKDFVGNKSSGELRSQVRDLEEDLLGVLRTTKANWGFEVTEIRIEDILTK